MMELHSLNLQALTVLASSNFMVLLVVLHLPERLLGYDKSPKRIKICFHELSPDLYFPRSLLQSKIFINTETSQQKHSMHFKSRLSKRTFNILTHLVFSHPPLPPSSTIMLMIGLVTRECSIRVDLHNLN